MFNNIIKTTKDQFNYKTFMDKIFEYIHDICMTLLWPLGCIFENLSYYTSNYLSIDLGFHANQQITDETTI